MCVCVRGVDQGELELLLRRPRRANVSENVPIIKQTDGSSTLHPTTTSPIGWSTRLFFNSAKKWFVVLLF